MIANMDAEARASLRHYLILFRLMPRAIDKAHLQWGLASLSKHNPQHPDVGYILRRLHELEAKR